MTVALISPTFSLRRISTGIFPSRICWRISGTHLGQSESVSRGQPSLGFCFSQLFSSGLSDHFGVKPGFGLIALILLYTNQAALAPRAMAFSTCLIGLVMSLVPCGSSPKVIRFANLPRWFSILDAILTAYIKESKRHWLHWMGIMRIERAPGGQMGKALCGNEIEK